MELKTTLFAIFAVLVIGIRNKKIAELEGKKSGRYTDLKTLLQSHINSYKKMFQKAKNCCFPKRR